MTLPCSLIYSVCHSHDDMSALDILFPPPTVTRPSHCPQGRPGVLRPCATTQPPPLVAHRGVPVCSGLLRIFGQLMAELPLVATAATARRQGHCRVLMTAIEDQLKASAQTQTHRGHSGSQAFDASCI